MELQRNAAEVSEASVNLLMASVTVISDASATRLNEHLAEARVEYSHLCVFLVSLEEVLMVWLKMEDG